MNTLALDPAEVNATPACVLTPADYRAALEADYAAADLDASWPLSDAEADRLADEAESYSMYEAGHPAW